MTKNKIMLVLVGLLLVVVSESIYTTFAYEEEMTALSESSADNNLIYSLKENSSEELIVGPQEEKFIDIRLENTYDATIKYGMYYYLISPNKLPDGVEVSLAEGSIDILENIIKSGSSRTISIKVKNQSEYTVDIIIGALIGFENGEIKDLLTEGETLIK